MNKKAVVLISGGLDSTICLALAKSLGFDCYALTFDYGQKHSFEITVAKKAVSAIGAKDHKIIRLSLQELCPDSALTNPGIDVPQYEKSEKIPITYVPARNTIFLSVALSWAETLEAYDIFIGSSIVDYSGYPDDRPEYMAAFERLANLATKAGVEGTHFKIQAPLLYLSKAQTIELGLELGVDLAATSSCYQPNSKGKACGYCDSCALRKKGFEEAGIEDPTLYD